MESQKLKVFYDGACHLCSREIDMYRKTDVQSRLELIDISSEGFDARAEGLDPEEVLKSFHVKTVNGAVRSGVPAFVEIWKTLNIMQPLAQAYQWAPTRLAMDSAYRVFAKVRPLLPKKKCDTGVCKV